MSTGLVNRVKSATGDKDLLPESELLILDPDIFRQSNGYQITLTFDNLASPSRGTVQVLDGHLVLDQLEIEGPDEALHAYRHTTLYSDRLCAALS